MVAREDLKWPDSTTASHLRGRASGALRITTTSDMPHITQAQQASTCSGCEASLSISGVPHIARTPAGEQMLGLGRVAFYLLAYAAYVHSQARGLPQVFLSPSRLDELLL